MRWYRNSSVKAVRGGHASILGSMTLQSMIVTFCLLSFLSLSWDLSRYLVALNAVQAASEATARCLLSSNVHCGDISAQRELNEVREWFGYPIVERQEVFAYTKDIEVQVKGGAYQVQVPTYNLQRYQRGLSLTKSVVPVTEFVGVLNSWAILRADISVNVEHTASGRQFLCVLKNGVEVPWGVDFSSADTYFDSDWCNAFDLEVFATSDSNCAEILSAPGEYRRSPRPDWGASSCRLVLPGAPETIEENSGVENPWLLLSGEAVCDDELAITQGSPALATLPIFSIPSSPPWGTAEPGEKDKPYPISFERQYIKLDVPTCHKEATLAHLNAKYLVRGGDEQGRIEDLHSLAAELGLKEFLSGALGDSETFYSNAVSQQASPVEIVSQLYGWTYLLWQRFVGTSESREITLSRKVCEWLPLDEAKRRGYTDLPELRTPNDGLSFIEKPGECAAAFELEERYSCSAWFSQNTEEVEACPESAGLLRRLHEEDQSSRVSLQHFRERLPDELVSEFPYLTEVSAAQLGSGLTFSSEQEIVEEITAPLPLEGYRLQSTEHIALSLFASKQKAPTQDRWKRLLQQRFPEVDLNNFLFETILREVILPSLSYRTEFQHSFAVKAEDYSTEELVSSELLLSQSESRLPQNIFDANLDCQFDDPCGQSYSTSTYRELVMPSLEDFVESATVLESLDFSYEDEPSYEPRLLGVFADGDQASFAARLPKCAAILTTCEGAPLFAPSYLGKYSGFPEICSLGEFVDCYPESLRESLSADEAEYRYAEAARAGLKEMRRFFPDASLRDAESPCGDGCLEYSFEDGPNETLEIRARSSVEVSKALRLLSGQHAFSVSSSSRIPAAN